MMAWMEMEGSRWILGYLVELNTHHGSLSWIPCSDGVSWGLNRCDSQEAFGGQGRGESHSRWLTEHDGSEVGEKVR